MRILFDQGVPAPLRQQLSHDEVATAYQRGWSKLRNSELLDAAETSGVTVVVTTDANLKYQQNLKSRRIAIVVLSTTSWPCFQNAVGEVVRVVDASVEGGYTEIGIP